MVAAVEAVIWINRDTSQVMIWPHIRGRPDMKDGHWTDPIGAAYATWKSATNDQRARLMTETAIDLAMQGFALKDVLTTFAQVPEFKALGSESYPMCRALTAALVGKSLEPNTMSFEDLLKNYAPA